MDNLQANPRRSGQLKRLFEGWLRGTSVGVLLLGGLVCSSCSDCGKTQHISTNILSVKGDAVGYLEVTDNPHKSINLNLEIVPGGRPGTEKEIHRTEKDDPCAEEDRGQRIDLRGMLHPETILTYESLKEKVDALCVGYLMDGVAREGGTGERHGDVAGNDEVDEVPKAVSSWDNSIRKVVIVFLYVGGGLFAVVLGIFAVRYLIQRDREAKRVEQFKKYMISVLVKEGLKGADCTKMMEINAKTPSLGIKVSLKDGEISVGDGNLN